MTTPPTPSPAPGSRAITLGGRTFNVPPLPLRHNRVVYPIVRALSADPLEAESFIGRLQAADGTPDGITPQELDQLADAAFHAASAGDWTLTRDEFEDLPISPVQLVEAFFLIRLQTGGWMVPENDNAGSAAEGEAKGEAPGA